METAPDRERLEWLGRAIDALLESSDVQERMTDAFRRDDPNTFAKILPEHWRKYDIQPPADKCDPYVTAYIFATLQPFKLVRCCYWVPPPGTSSICWDPPPPTEDVLQELIAKGLVQCVWETEKPAFELHTIKKFVGGICPPGTF